MHFYHNNTDRFRREYHRIDVPIGPLTNRKTRTTNKYTE